MKEIVVLAEAAKDIEAARDFYDAIASGIGEYCVDSLLADIESLRLYSGIHRYSFGLHRMLAKRFPFAIYYREANNQTEVLAILDLRRRPGWLRAELEKRP